MNHYADVGAPAARRTGAVTDLTDAKQALTAIEAIVAILETVADSKRKLVVQTLWELVLLSEGDAAKEPKP